MADLTARQRLLAGVFARLRNFDMGTLKGRIVVQKTVYFLQQLGGYLGYRYSWYVYGPYSPSLAKDAFALWAVPDRPTDLEPTAAHLSPVLDRLAGFLGDRSRDAVWLEALGSLHMLSKLYPNDSAAALVRRVLTKAPYFKQQECEKAWQYLVAHGLVAERLAS